MKFRSEDNGNCRVYYRHDGRLYCWQDEGSWGQIDLKFLVCSRDGEPSHPVEEPSETPQCPGETATGRALNDFLKIRSLKDES